MSRDCLKRGLGDRIERALRLVGLTADRVEAWLKRPCGCAQRRERLNRLGLWAARIVMGKRDSAEKYLNELMDE